MGEYEPNSVLEMLHNSPRVKGSNEIPVAADFSTESFTAGEGEQFDYTVGVVAGGVIGLVCFLIWVIVLCCTGCCKKNMSLGNKPEALMFGVLMVLSTFGWFYAIGAFALTTDGVDTLVANAAAFAALGADVVGTASDGVAVMADFGTGVTAVASNCSALTGFSFDASNVTEFVDPLQEVLSEVETALDGVEDDIRKLEKEINPIVDQTNIAVKVLVFSIIGLIAIFTFSTEARILGFGERNACVVGVSKVSGGLFLTLGIVLLLLIWILILFMSPISTFGADLCVPSPNSNILRILSEVTKDSRPAGVGFCEEAPFSYLCYYQTCEGPDPLGGDLINATDITTELSNLLVEALQQYDDIVATNFGGVPPAGAEGCRDSIEALQPQINGVGTSIDAVRTSVACANVNPLYRGMVEDGFCNGIMAGMGTTWIVMALGASALMTAMIVYRCFDFENRYKGPEYQGEHDYDYGGRVAPGKDDGIVVAKLA